MQAYARKGDRVYVAARVAVVTHASRLNGWVYFRFLDDGSSSWCSSARLAWLSAVPRAWLCT